MIINSYIHSSLLDFSGWNLTHIWSLFKTSEATIPYCLKVAPSGNTSDPDYKYWFYDNNGEISVSSQVSTTTTADESTTVQEMFDGAGSLNWHIEHWYDQITATSVVWAAGGSAPRIAEANIITTKNSKQSVKYVSAGSSSASGVSTLDSGNDWSVTSVTNNDGGTAQGIVMATNKTDTSDYFTMTNDNRTNKDLSILKDNVGTTIRADDSSQHNTSNQKRLTTTMDASANMQAYYNGSAADAVDASSQTGYTNDGLAIGHVGTAAVLTGNVQFIGLHNIILTGTNVTDLDALLDTYFSF